MTSRYVNVWARALTVKSTKVKSLHQVKRNSDEKLYALKKISLFSLKPREIQNALNEIRIMSSIQNPYVISYKESFYDENSKCLCLIMEYA